MKTSKSITVMTGVLALTLLLPLMATSAENEEVLLDSFEGEISQKTVDFGASQNSSMLAKPSTDIKACGNQSIQLNYELNPEGYMFCARGYGLDIPEALWEGPEPQKIEWKNFNAISLQMYGNKTGQIAFDVKDDGGELWRFLINDDFQGWKEIVIPFQAFTVRTDWQPSMADGNMTLDFPIKNFQWEPKTQGKNTLYFDCVKLIKIKEQE